LGKAITTENRRIRKVVTAKQQEIETAIAIPKATINLKDMVKTIREKLKSFFTSGREHPVAFSELLGDKNHISEERVNHFVPLLHLDNQHKVLLEQEKHLEEIYVWMKEHHDKKFAKELEQMRKEAEIAAQQEMLEQEQEDSYKKAPQKNSNK